MFLHRTRIGSAGAASRLERAKAWLEGDASTIPAAGVSTAVMIEGKDRAGSGLEGGEGKTFYASAYSLNMNHWESLNPTLRIGLLKLLHVYFQQSDALLSGSGCAVAANGSAGGRRGGREVGGKMRPGC